MKIIVSKRYVALTPMCIPIFVAGPIRGGGDWQAEYVEGFMAMLKSDCTRNHFAALEPRIRFIVPCRWNDEHPLAGSFASSFELDDYNQNAEEESQTRWEIHYLDQIVTERNQGMVAFGLLPESEEHPRDDGSPYGRDSYGEIGRWPTVAHFRKASNIYIGMHARWGGREVIQKNVKFWSKDRVCAHVRDVHSVMDFARWSAESLRRNYLGK